MRLSSEHTPRTVTRGASHFPSSLETLTEEITPIISSISLNSRCKMTDPMLFIDRAPPPDKDFGSGLAIPPLDDAFFSQHFMDSQDSGCNQNGVFQEDMDFDFSFDDLCIPTSELDELLSEPIDNDQFKNDYLLDKVNDGSGLRLDQYHGVFKSDCAKLRHLNNIDGDQRSNGSGVLESESPGLGSNQISGYLNMPSPESNGSNRGSSESACGDAKRMNCPSPESHGSGNCGSDVSEKSENCTRSVKSLSNINTSLSSDENVDQKNDFGNSPNNYGNGNMLKRKKESDNIAFCNVDDNSESRINKFRKSECSMETNLISDCLSGLNEEDQKKKARLVRNRESAQISRQRKKQYVEELEDKVRTMHVTIQDLNAKISFFMTENMTLRQQMGANGSNIAIPPQIAPPQPGMYAPPPMIYPWMSSAPPFLMRPHGSQVPLVPIPRLKSQQPAPVPKVSKKGGSARTKKVASVCFIGLLIFIMVFGGMFPFINMGFGGIRDSISSDNSYAEGAFFENYQRRVSTGNWIEHGGGREFSCSSGCENCSRRGHGVEGDPSINEVVHLRNGSEPLLASLYVPRNDKLVKIDGNLIIHSVLASEKAMISQGHRGDENGLAVRGNSAPAVPVPVPVMGRNGARVPHLRALGSGSVDEENLKSKAHEGRLQQWFREGLAGPMFSSGMCSEVFQFDVSSASTLGAIVPATTSRNISEQQNKNSTNLSKVRNRRIFQHHPIPLHGLSHNVSEEQRDSNSRNKNLNGNNSASSVVVSVLVDPREASTDVDGMMGSKALSRIFVVVLIDSVKYVTYSCMLPFKGAAPHLVST